MTNRQLNFENIHRVENLTYEPLEKEIHQRAGRRNCIDVYRYDASCAVHPFGRKNYPIVLSLLPV